MFCNRPSKPCALTMLPETVARCRRMLNGYGRSLSRLSRLRPNTSFLRLVISLWCDTEGDLGNACQDGVRVGRTPEEVFWLSKTAR